MSVRFPLIVLVGPSGVGKTHFVKWVTDTYRREYRIAKSVTTRQQRDAEDRQFYDFLSHPMFEQSVRERKICETAIIRNERYGLHLQYLRGLFIRPTTSLISLNVAGVNFLKTFAPDIAEKMVVVELVPKDEAVLLENLLRRHGGNESTTQQELLRTMQETRPAQPNAIMIMAGRNNHLPTLHDQMRVDLGLPPV